MSMIPLKPKVYDDGRTKQSFKDETDINKILSRAQKTGTISHLAKYQGTYGDFSNFDFFEAQQKLIQGREIFDELPSEVRKEFNQNPAQFFAYVNDPANAPRIQELLPALAAPGRQNIDVSGRTPPDVPQAPQAPQATTTAPQAETHPMTAPAPPEGAAPSTPAS